MHPAHAVTPCHDRARCAPLPGIVRHVRFALLAVLAGTVFFHQTPLSARDDPFRGAAVVTPGAVSDFFPLRVGAAFRYGSLDTGYVSNAIGNSTSWWRNVGVVKIAVLDSVFGTNAQGWWYAFWIVQREDSVLHHETSRGGGAPAADTTYWTTSSEVDTVWERLAGDHVITSHFAPWSFAGSDNVARYVSSVPDSLHLSAGGGDVTLVRDRGLTDRARTYVFYWSGIYMIQFQRWWIIDSSTVDSAEAPGQPPEAPVLLQNYPNPFNPATRIEFRIAHEGEVRLTVVNVLGEKVATIVAGIMAPGRYVRTWDAAGLPGGVYFLRLESGNFSDTKKLLLLR
jgi:hypothetical protein